MSDPDPVLYRQLAEPFESLDTANEAVTAFFELVKKAREQCGLPDVVVLVEAVVQGRVSATLYLGDETNRLPIVARAYGAARAEHESMITRAVEAGRKLALKEH